jgi:aminoglycoside phosphotransferase (APT) family kinase protein
MKPDIEAVIESRIAAAWPGTTLTTEPVPLTGGFWASMYRLRLDGQPPSVPGDVVFRIAPDAPMGAKEIAVQQTIAEMGFPTPHVRLTGAVDTDLGGIWSVMDFAVGAPPLGNLNGIAALRGAAGLFARLPVQLAAMMAGIHRLDPEPVSAAVAAVTPTVAWTVEDLCRQFEASADALSRPDLAASARALTACRPAETTAVICHGDLHPFNLLVEKNGDVVVVDWTAAIRADPAYDVAFTAMLLGNPPLDAPGPLRPVIRWIGSRLARRFVTRYRAIAIHDDLGALAWYRALHGTRILIEAASLDARGGSSDARHPFQALVPVAVLAVSAVTGTPITTPR